MSPVIISKSDNFNQCRGFTLLELIVVIALLGVMLAFAVPRLHTDLLTSDSRKVSQWIVLSVKQLKQASVQSQIPHRLNVDMDRNRLWTEAEAEPAAKADAETGEAAGLDEMPALENRKGNELELPRGFRVIDVQFAGFEPLSSGVATIRFYEKGYCDYALIHMEDDRTERRTYVIEPFLPEVEIHETYQGF